MAVTAAVAVMAARVAPAAADSWAAMVVKAAKAETVVRAAAVVLAVPST